MHFLDQSISHSSIEQTFRLQSELMKFLDHPISIRLNSNSSSFVSVRFGEAKKPISASIHKFFVNAPESVMKALALFISGGGTDRSITEILKKFIQTMNDKTKSATPLIQYESRGKWHDLSSYYSRLNEIYFNGEVSTQVTWFTSRKGAAAKSRCFLGLYIDELSLIKINSLLDDKETPDFVVESIVYHEMLHAVYPPYEYPSGRRVIHTKEFKEAEKKYPKLLDAENWLNDNRSRFFKM